MVGVLIRMKWRVLRHSLRGKQAALTAGGAVFGLLAALGTVLATTVSLDRPGAAVDLLAAVYLLWTIGWLLGPVLTGGGDETLRPEHFALLPIPPRRLAAGLLGAAFVGVPAIVTFLASWGLVVQASGAAAVVVAVLAVPLQLTFVVVLSRVVMAGLGAAMQSRRGRDLGVLLVALVGLSGFLFQVVGRAVGPVLVEGRSAVLSTVLRALPSGWGVTAVDAAGHGDWLVAAGALAGLVAVIAALLAVWGVLLVRRTTRVPASGPVRTRAGRTPLGSRLPATPVGAVVGKELRTWGRDARRRVALLSAVITAVIVTVAPVANGGGTGAVPTSGLVLVAIGAVFAGNLYGMDGSALWHTLVVPGAAAADVRGRQLAWLLLMGPVVLVLAVVLPGITDPGTYPLVLGLTPALLGAGAGLVVLLSVFVAYPMPAQRANPFSSGGNPGLLRVLLQIAIALLLAVVAAPVALLVWLAPALEWLGVPVGIGLGVLCWWWWGGIARHRLDRRGPELLAEIAKPV
ncbi:MAG: hypothetical protein GEV28_12855 [Actinophytocola sp.]|uniref:hypothetical protein n=1 Tax=Actinophytocola sp. TaxID=1872138 RepID=UPI0013279E93|nr:hypothetical protein [Actinophytocola sp.]MPZ81229.1 hypothetical protein [Actinophytocola sp.]